jgi:hypothetical protein
MKNIERRALAKKNALLDIIKKFRSGVVIVEGFHDVSVLKSFDINARTYYSVMTSRKVPMKKVFYIAMDDDKGGIDKRDKLISKITELDSSANIDIDTGIRFLKILGIKSIEQAFKPLSKILES